MKFNLKFMREFFKFFHKTETQVQENYPESDVFNTKEIGVVNVMSPEGFVNIPLKITPDERDVLNTAWMMKTVGGEYAIVFHIDHFVKCYGSEDMNDLYATVAHEIGHYLAGHFEKNANGNVDVKPEVQEFFFNRYQGNKTEANEVAYMRSVFFALLKGGVIIKEIEADLIALRFVELNDLVHIHTEDFQNKKNPFTVLEKVNRIRRLNKFSEDNDIDRQGYSLYIKLHEIEKQAT